MPKRSVIRLGIPAQRSAQKNASNSMMKVRSGHFLVSAVRRMDLDVRALEKKVLQCAHEIPCVNDLAFIANAMTKRQTTPAFWKEFARHCEVFIKEKYVVGKKDKDASRIAGGEQHHSANGVASTERNVHSSDGSGINFGDGETTFPSGKQRDKTLFSNEHTELIPDSRGIGLLANAFAAAKVRDVSLFNTIGEALMGEDLLKSTSIKDLALCLPTFGDPNTRAVIGETILEKHSDDAMSPNGVVNSIGISQNGNFLKTRAVPRSSTASNDFMNVKDATQLFLNADLKFLRNSEERLKALAPNLDGVAIAHLLQSFARAEDEERSFFKKSKTKMQNSFSRSLFPFFRPYILKNLANLDHHTLAMLVNAYARLSICDQEVLAALFSRGLEQIESGSVDHIAVASFLNSQVKLGIVEASYFLAAKKWCEGLLSSGESSSSTCSLPLSPASTGTVIPSSSTLKTPTSRFATPSRTTTQTNLSTCNAQSISTLLHAFAKADRRRWIGGGKEGLAELSVLFHLFVPHVIRRLDEFTPQNVCNTLGAFAAIGQSDEDMFTACANRFLELKRKWVPQDVANISTAFSRSGIFHEKLYFALAEYRFDGSSSSTARPWIGAEYSTASTSSSSSSSLSSGSLSQNNSLGTEKKQTSGMLPFELSAYINSLATFYDKRNESLCKTIEETLQAFSTEPLGTTASETAVLLNAYGKVGIVDDAFARRCVLHHDKPFTGVSFVLALATLARMKINLNTGTCSSDENAFTGNKFAEQKVLDENREILRRFAVSFSTLKDIDVIHTGMLLNSLSRLDLARFHPEWVTACLQHVKLFSSDSSGSAFLKETDTKRRSPTRDENGIKLDGKMHQDLADALFRDSWHSESVPLRKVQRRYGGLRSNLWNVSSAAVLFHASCSLLTVLTVLPDVDEGCVSKSGTPVSTTKVFLPLLEQCLSHLRTDVNITAQISSRGEMTRVARQTLQGMINLVLDPSICSALSMKILVHIFDEIGSLQRVIESTGSYNKGRSIVEPNADESSGVDGNDRAIVENPDQNNGSDVMQGSVGSDFVGEALAERHTSSNLHFQREVTNALRGLPNKMFIENDILGVYSIDIVIE